MTTPPWGHKPPRVDDHYRYWGKPPPEPSARLTYWLRRLDERSWHRSKYLAVEGYDTSANVLGVYIWEWINVLAPACSENDRLHRRAHPRDYGDDDAT